MKLLVSGKFKSKLFFLVFGTLNVHNALAINYDLNAIVNKPNCNNGLSIYGCEDFSLGLTHKDSLLFSKSGVKIQGAPTIVPDQEFSDAINFYAILERKSEILLNVGNLANYAFNLGGLSADTHNQGTSKEASFEQREVPLPAAIWLFGSAITGFVLFSARRKV